MYSLFFFMDNLKTSVSLGVSVRSFNICISCISAVVHQWTVFKLSNSFAATWPHNTKNNSDEIFIKREPVT